MTTTLSIKQARKLVLHAQRLPPGKQAGRAVDATLAAFENLGEWSTKPAKQALENLFMQGDLMISQRVNFHKVYDLTERVLPDHVDRSVPSLEEFARYLIVHYLKANGVGQLQEILYGRKNVRDEVITALEDMVASGEVLPVCVDDSDYYVQPDSRWTVRCLMCLSIL